MEIIAFCFRFNRSEKGLWISVKSCVQLPVPGSIATAVSLECKGSVLCYCCDCIEWESCLFQACIAVISCELMQSSERNRDNFFLDTFYSTAVAQIHSAEMCCNQTPMPECHYIYIKKKKKKEKSVESPGGSPPEFFLSIWYNFQNYQSMSK